MISIGKDIFLNMSQLNLLPKNIIDEEYERSIKKYGFILREVDIGDITFQRGQFESIHRWHRLTPSFSPSLVRYFISLFNISKSSLVLDPFCGRGTTVIECQKLGIPSIGFEINPLLMKAGSLSLQWIPVKSNLYSKYLEKLAVLICENSSLDINATIKKLGTSTPNIHDVYRWWRPDVLKNLLIARELSRNKDFEEIHHLLWLCLSMAAIDCANIHRNHPTITFDDNNNRIIDVIDTIKLRLHDIESDLHRLTAKEINYNGLGKIHLFNSCEPIDLSIYGMDNFITNIVTSPPYPNRFSYIHQTRPQLYFMEVINDRSEATEIDIKTIGGTWGRATSDLMKGFIDPPEELKDILDYIDLLRPKSLLMCNYATKYFIDLNRHIYNLRKIVRNGFRGAYIVGNSRLAGIDIYTDVILSRIFELNNGGIRFTQVYTISCG
jgi:hypothetical protein